jgi:3-oxoadipate enol-lactonase
MPADLATLERGMAEVNDTRLYYEVCGTGPALLFVHGYTLDHRMWTRQVQALSVRFRTVIYDCRGFGCSAMPASQRYSHSADAAALCEHLGIEHVIAVGHSVGAYHALELALACPELVAGLVAVCPTPPAAVPTGIPFPDDLERMFSAIGKAARAGSLDAAKDIWRRAEWFAPARELPVLAAELDRILHDYSGWDWTHPNPVQYAEPFALDSLAGLEIPALVVTGGRDLDFNDEVAQLIMKRVPSASALRLPRAGHLANMEDAAAVNRAIAEFVPRAGL